MCELVEFKQRVRTAPARPVLSQVTAALIVDGLQAWPHGMGYAGRDVVRDQQTGALVGFAEPEEEALFEDASWTPGQPRP